MAPRQNLHSVLTGICENAYFQPPSNVQMQFPCIVYERDGSNAREFKYADNGLYRLVKRYQVTVIDRNPDSELPDLVEELPMCQFDRFFAADNLNHWVLNLFY
jgi:hypothetical protein